MKHTQYHHHQPILHFDIKNRLINTNHTPIATFTNRRSALNYGPLFAAAPDMLHLLREVINPPSLRPDYLLNYYQNVAHALISIASYDDIP